MTVRCNVGKTEKILRLGAAIVLIFTGVWWWPLAALGGVVLISALIGWCPLRAVLGISSCEGLERIPADTTGTPKDEEDRRRRFK